MSLVVAFSKLTISHYTTHPEKFHTSIDQVIALCDSRLKSGLTKMWNRVKKIAKIGEILVLVLPHPTSSAEEHSSFMG